jgi:hypothetical protein
MHSTLLLMNDIAVRLSMRVVMFVWVARGPVVRATRGVLGRIYVPCNANLSDVLFPGNARSVQEVL